MKEIWKDVPGYEGFYRASNTGRVMTLQKSIKLRHKGNLLNTETQCCVRNGKGYKTVTLYRDDLSPKQIMVHRLVALTFIPNPLGKPQVNHKDGDKHNNNVSNLEWVTDRENRDHAINMGLSGRGEKNSQAKLTSLDVAIIRNVYNKGRMNQREISKRFGICKQHVSSIVNNKVWR